MLAPILPLRCAHGPSCPTFCCVVSFLGHRHPSLACLWSYLPRQTIQLTSLGYDQSSDHLFGSWESCSFFSTPSNLEESSLGLREAHLPSYVCLLSPLLLGFWELKLGFLLESSFMPSPEALNKDLNGEGTVGRGRYRKDFFQ